MSNHKAIKPKVACPGCGRKQDYRGANAIYFCQKCNAQFDDDPDEGGTYTDRPEGRLDRIERQQQREREQRAKRLGVRR